MNRTLVLLVLLCLSGAVRADWYFRGTPNGWGSTQMTVGTHADVYQTCQTFDGGDGNGAARFKFDRFADWSENYGDNNGDGVADPAGNDIVVANGSYDIDFDVSSKVYGLTPVSDCGGEGGETPVCSLPSLHLRGTFNGWSSTAMSCVDDGVWSGVAEFGSAGDERFKFDVYADWSQNYGDNQADGIADAGGNDIPVGTAGSYTVTLDESTMAYALSCDAGACAGGGGGGGGGGNGQNGDFRSETIYFVLTARFYDGDASNNYYNRDRILDGDPHWRGDFKGLIERLDYIQDLGFTAIWVTPPVTNRSGLDYHGYHAYDWTEVDPRLESDGASYQDLIDAVHARGMKIVQDVVVNHSSQYGIRDQVWIDHLPIKYYVPAGGAQGEVDNGPYQGHLGDYLSTYRDDNDNPVAPQWFRDRHDSDAAGIVPLVDPKTGTTVPLAGYDANRFFGIDAGTLDEDWYHQDGFISGGDWESPIPLQTKHLAGDTIDLYTEKAGVQDYLNDAIETYLDMGVDAIRIDTVKHVERDNLIYDFVQPWQAHKPGLFVFGENLVKGRGFGSEIENDNASAVIRPWWYTRTGSDPSNPSGDSGLSMLDFSLFSTFRDNLTQGNFSQIGSVLSMDWVYADPTRLVTFFQNHDVGPDNDFKYRYCCSEANAALAYNLLWTIRGIPALYYGEEIMFQAGLPQDIAGNNDVLADTGRAYYGDHLSPANLATTQAQPLYRHIQRLNQIRAAIPALQKAPMSSVQEFGSGISFVRNFNGGASVAVVGLAAGSAQSFTVSGIPNGTYRDAVSGNVVGVAGGSISFSVPDHSAGIYVLDGPGKIGTDGVYLR